MNSETVRREVHVDGTSDEWESRCEQALRRRPFRLTGSSLAATDGRAFAASYHWFGASVDLVLDVVHIDANRTLLSVEGTPRQDNPLAQLIRNPATGATRGSWKGSRRPSEVRSECRVQRRRPAGLEIGSGTA